MPASDGNRRGLGPLRRAVRLRCRTPPLHPARRPGGRGCRRRGRRVKIQFTFERSQVAARTWPVLIDLTVAACGLALFFAVVQLGGYWLGKPTPAVVISHSVRALPLYAFYSVVRIFIAYLLSLIFAVSYGYIAAYNPRI